MTLGWEAAISQSAKQEINSWSLIKTELVGGHDMLLTILIARVEVTVAYESTDEIWADFINKPLQGWHFNKFCNLNEFVRGASFGLQECVEEI